MRYWRTTAPQICFALVALLVGGADAAPLSADGPELTMLSTLVPGNWDVRMRPDGSHSSICLRTGRELIQIRHRQLSCTRTVVEDTPNQVTVEYSCAGSGYGRTTIRRESAQLVQINSQGIANGLPFHFDAEARHVGSC